MCHGAVDRMSARDPHFWLSADTASRGYLKDEVLHRPKGTFKAAGNMVLALGHQTLAISVWWLNPDDKPDADVSMGKLVHHGIPW